MKQAPILSGISAFLAALSILPSPARADSGVPAATSLASCTADDGSNVSGTSSCAVDNSTGSVTTAPSVLLTASAAYGGGGPASSGGFVVLNYNFAVVGGTHDAVVPVDIDVVLQQSTVNSADSPAYGFSEIVVNTPRTSTDAVICSSLCADASNGLATTLQVDVLADELGSNAITLEIEALAAGYADIPPNSASASADPRIYVDPSFADASAYSIVLSDGVGNGNSMAAVPEPGTLALMLAGLALIGFGAEASRRRPRARSSKG
jgi:hypothetical protein